MEGISISEMPLGKSISEKNLAGAGLILNGGVINERLGFDLAYDTGLYEDEEAQAFALAYKSAVTDVVKVCLSKETIVKTPSDFGIDISPKALQHIEEIIGIM
jgi:hypothetical protein